MKHNVEKFEKYLEKYHKQVMGSAARYGNPVNAEDVAMETFRKMYTRLEYLNDENVLPWLLTVSRNLAKDHEKKGGQFSEIISPIEQITEWMDVQETQESAEDTVRNAQIQQEQRMFLQRVGDLLYQKNPSWYFIMIDAVILEMDNTEIAKILGVSVESVYLMRNRARKFAQKHFGKEAKKYLYEED